MVFWEHQPTQLCMIVTVWIVLIFSRGIIVPNLCRKMIEMHMTLIIRFVMQGFLLDTYSVEELVAQKRCNHFFIYKQSSTDLIDFRLIWSPFIFIFIVFVYFVSLFLYFFWHMTAGLFVWRDRPGEGSPSFRKRTCWWLVVLTTWAVVIFSHLLNTKSTATLQNA